MPAPPLPSQRHLFDLPDDVAYLNCAYMSPLLRSGRAAAEAGLDRQSRPWSVPTEAFFGPPDQLRALAAGLLDGDADAVALTPSVSYGVSLVAANLPAPRPGATVVLLAEQFPSNVYPWRAYAARHGARVVAAPRSPDDDWTPGVLAAIDERTAVVAVEQVHWTDGSLIDLAAVGTRAAEVGAALVVDVTQSLGAYPFDLASIRPAAVVTALYKWLLGPYSVGFVWLAPELREGAPLEWGWMGRAGADEDFARLVEYQDVFRPGARRYDVGETANFGLLPIAIDALTQVHSWTVEGISAGIAPLTAQVEARTRALGLDPVPAERRAPHIIGVRFPADVPLGLDERLRQAGVHVSMRGRSMRVSPHLYNRPEDVDRLVAVVASAV